MSGMDGVVIAVAVGLALLALGLMFAGPRSSPSKRRDGSGPARVDPLLLASALAVAGLSAAVWLTR